MLPGVWNYRYSREKSFEIEYGTSIDEFLDSVYLAGAELTGTNIEYQAKCIERSNKMLKLVDSSIDLLRNKHKNGETFYWVLYYTYLSPQEVGSVLDIIEAIRPHVKYISYRTYYRYRREAIEPSVTCCGAIRPGIVWNCWKSFFRISKPPNRISLFQLRFPTSTRNL